MEGERLVRTAGMLDSDKTSARFISSRSLGRCMWLCGRTREAGWSLSGNGAGMAYLLEIFLGVASVDIAR